MEITMLVELAGWGWLRFAQEQVTVTIRASYVSNVMTDVVGVIAEVAGGADSAQTYLGLEPGLVTLRLQRHDDRWSALSLQVGENHGAQGTFDFRLPTGSLTKLGLDLAASVDRETYLDSWSPQGTWPTDALDRLHKLAARA